MRIELWGALLAVAFGTYLLRAVPLHWMQRHLSRRSRQNTATPVWLTLSGPLMIAALLGVSSVPSRSTPEAWVAAALGLLVTALGWYRRRDLGVPIVAGVIAYGSVTWLADVLIA